jgi:hypothetical protein
MILGVLSEMLAIDRFTKRIEGFSRLKLVRQGS